MKLKKFRNLYEEKKKIKVVYHENCHDGTGSAWVAWKVFGEKADYIPMSYGYTDYPKGEKGDTIYMIDFSLKKDEIEKIKENGARLIILDHHESAQKNLKGISDCIFDMDRSGTGIAWDFFFPKEKRPLMVDLIEDRDLWNYKLKDTKAFYCYMMTLKYDFRKLDEVYESMKKDPEIILSKGREMEKLYQSLVDEFSHNPAGEIVVESSKKKHTIPIFNLPKEFGSDVCSTFLDESENEVAAYFGLKDKKTVSIGLRSKENTVRVNDIAETYGGGGHPEASGFALDSITFLEKLV